MNTTQVLPEKTSWLRLYTSLSGLMIILLLVTAGAGLFGSNIYDDFTTPEYVQESRAQDLITLVLGVPLLVVALWRVRRGDAWGLPLWLGILAYELYVYAIYAVGAVLNSFFLGYVAVAGLSIYTIIGLLSSVDARAFQQQVRATLPRRWIGGFFTIIVVIFTMIWLGAILDSISTGEEDNGHLIFVFDLIIVLPAFGITAYNLFRKNPFGDLLAGMLLIKFVSLCISITLGQVFRSLNDLATESELLMVFIPLGLISLLFTLFYFRNSTREA